MLIDILCALNVNLPLDSRLLGIPDQKDGRSLQGGSFQVWIFTQPPFSKHNGTEYYIQQEQDQG